MIKGARHLPSFFVPTPGHLNSLCVPTPGNLPFFQKNTNARGLALGGGGGAGGAWALLELTDALLHIPSRFERSVCVHLHF